MDFAIFLEGLLNVWKLRGVDVAPAGAPRGLRERRP
jgi:hypothetical protein